MTCFFSRFPYRLSQIIAVVILLIGFFPGMAFAAGLNNIPVGDWKEEAFIKILNYTARPYLQSTRPFKRREVARILLEIKNNPEYDGYFEDRFFKAHFSALEKALRKDIEELDAFGANGKFDFSFHPVDQVKIEVAKLVPKGEVYYKDIGELCRDCDQGQIWISHQFQWENYLSAYFQESGVITRSHWDERKELDEREEFFVEEGYGKIQLFNVELEVGRDHMWWGSGYDGTLMLTNNAPAFDLIKLSNFAPFTLPWYFKYLGPINLAAFITQLEKERYNPKPFLSGIRVAIYPFEFIELGATRVLMSGGENGYSPKWYEFETIWSARKEHDSSELNLDQKAAVDWRLPITQLRRWTPINLLTIYYELGMEMLWWEEILRRDYYIRPSVRAQIYGLMVDLGRIEFHAEHTDTVTVWHDPNSFFYYKHFKFPSGYTYKGENIGHHIGGSAKQFYFETKAWITPELRTSVHYSWQIDRFLPGWTYTYQKGGMELRYAFTDAGMIDLAYKYGDLVSERWGIGEWDSSHHSMNLNFSMDF